MKGLQVEELYGLDETLLHELEPIFGLIFLFKWDPTLEGAKRRKSMAAVGDEGSAEAAPFFANQTVQNACATQALLSILMNLPPTAAGVELGSSLASFKDFCAGLTPELRGEAIGSNEVIRRVHNSFARPELAMLDHTDRQKRGEREEDAFHFISIMPIAGKVYEFDGLQPAPIRHEMSSTTASVGGDSAWLATALRVIEEKIAAIQGAATTGGEIRFNLMAVIKDRAILHRERIDAQVRLACQLESELRVQPPRGNPNEDPRQQQLQLLLASNTELEVRLEEEQARNARWARENACRRHNFIPLAISLLQELVNSGRAEKFLA